MVQLENDFLRVAVSPKGAEWKSLVEKVHGREFLWQGGPAWPETAPLLFPVIGTTKGGALPHHGFLRGREFQVAEREPWRAVFTTAADAGTRAIYPFDWTLAVEFRLWKRVVSVAFAATNIGSGPMPFQLGVHPGFQMPFFGEGDFERGFVDFELPETPERWLLDQDGLLTGEHRPLPTAGRSLVLTRALFADDAVIVKRPRSSRVTLRHQDAGAALSLEFPGFPYLALWSAPGADFVCVEPWCGLPDRVDASGDLTEREGVETLAPGATFRRTFAVTVEG